MPRNRNLLAALDAEKGRDVTAEKRQKQVKAAEKRKREQARLAKEATTLDGEDISKSPTSVDGASSHKVDESARDSSNADSNLLKSDVRHEDADADADPIRMTSEIGKTTTNSRNENHVLSEDEEDDDDKDVPLSDLSENDRADTIPHQRLTINNTAALLTASKRLRIARAGFKFSVHNSLISSIPTNIPDPDDDLTRELEFYRVCSSAAKEARTLFRKEDVPFTRPSDYFAEMVKTDDHMGRIKKKLYDEAARKKAASEARKQRDLKKFGKQVQIAKEQERAKEKRQTLDKISSLKRKRKGMDTGKVAEDDDLFDVGVEDDDNAKPKRRDQGGSNFKRQKRDQKYGFGGKKRFAKSGDAVSSGDMRDFSAKRMKQKKGPQRLGKSRRAAGR